jgi:hypothetical protein
VTRYYDPTIGRFISADTYVQDYTNPQTLNRYSYCQNNPLRYNDPTGHYGEGWDSATEGTYAWSKADNMWLIAFNGQWMPMNPESPQIAPEEPKPAVPGINNSSIPITGGITIGGSEILGGIDTIPWEKIIGIAEKWGPIGLFGIMLLGIMSLPGDPPSSYYAVKAPGIPTDKDGFEGKKGWDGHSKVRSPNGNEWGYPDDKGNVWVPNDHNGTHAPHWDVEHPGASGGYDPVYPH